MTIERPLARAGFTLTRDYPVALDQFWADGPNRSACAARDSPSKGQNR